MASQARQQSGIGSKASTVVIRVALDGNDPQEVLVAPLTFSLHENQLVRSQLAKMKRALELDEVEFQDELAAFVWVTLRRSDPLITFQEVAEAITIEAIADTVDVVPVEEQDSTDPS